MGGNYLRAKAAGTIGATIGGMIFMNHGQWEGKKNMLDVHLRRGENEPINKDIHNHYLKLNEIIKDNAFRSNNFYYIESMSGDKKDDFISYIREDEKSHYLVVVNYSDNDGCSNIPIYNIKGYRYCLLYDLLNDEEYIQTIDQVKNKGLNVCLKAWESHVFKYNY